MASLDLLEGEGQPSAWLGVRGGGQDKDMLGKRATD